MNLGDLLVIAERLFGLPAEQWARKISLADAEATLAAPFAGPGELDLYPDPVDQAAICGSRFISSRLFPVGNELVGYECMREMLERAECPWPGPRGDAEEVKRLAAGTTSEAGFVRWVHSRVELGERLGQKADGAVERWLGEAGEAEDEGRGAGGGEAVEG
ncbi:MAG: hypothetical protein M3335_02870 [Actinomycetota bacterium]|nr:hypothetical protein [Actinomycetota bacterium]